MLSIQEFCAASGLRVGDLVLGVTPSTKHQILLSSYLLDMWRGPEVVREMISADAFSASDFGAMEHAADLFLVLRKFLEDYPECWCNSERVPPWPVAPV